MLWFTADLHMGHNNIIIYEARPVYCFEYMVELWNRRVKPDDTIWVLGDFIWKGHDHWLPKFNGNVVLVRGSHDHGRGRHRKHGVEVLKPPVHLLTKELGEIVLTHVPNTTSSLINLCGHVHGWWKRLNNCINVGVDVWNFKPVNIGELTEYIYSTQSSDLIWDKTAV